MSEISRTALFGKLNTLCYKAIEGATVFCKLRGNPYVELVHWIQQILQTPDSDLHHIVRRAGLQVRARIGDGAAEAGVGQRRGADGAEGISQLASGRTGAGGIQQGVVSSLDG